MFICIGVFAAVDKLVCSFQHKCKFRYALSCLEFLARVAILLRYLRFRVMCRVMLCSRHVCRYEFDGSIEPRRRVVSEHVDLGRVSCNGQIQTRFESDSHPIQCPVSRSREVRQNFTDSHPDMMPRHGGRVMRAKCPVKTTKL